VLPAEQLPSSEHERAGLVASHHGDAPTAAVAVVSEVELHDWEAAADDQMVC
jgi:hypothetical protein